MIKPAFCFLIYDRIHNEDRWMRFLNQIDTNQYSIHIHSKSIDPVFKHVLFQKSSDRRSYFYK